MKEKVVTKTTINFASGLGTALATVLSYEANHSIGWAIVHGLFSWFYVIYRLF